MVDITTGAHTTIVSHNTTVFFMNLLKIPVLSALFLLLFFPTIAQPTRGMSSAEIQQSLEKLNVLGSVLFVAAHPDDENTRLLSYLANERKFRTGYISMTRGDGGQNLIGKEQSEELGMIRTRELLEARKVDGAEQFFTRANDFGYSKNPEETFNFWNKEIVLADVVWAIRKFRPDVIINRFPTTGEGGHGHHTASAMLALEAFRAAGDPKRFPEQLTEVSTWQARRIFLNSFVPRGQQPDYTGQLKLDVGAYNPLLGLSYGEMASASRSMHKSQGFGVASTRGTTYEYFKKLDGDTAVSELFEGIETDWSRVNNGDAIQKLISKTQLEFDSKHPEKSVASLLEILKLVRNLDNAYWKQVKEKEITKLIAGCAGLWMEVNALNYYCTPGDTITFNTTVISRLLPGVILDHIKIDNWDTLPSLALAKNEVTGYAKNIKLRTDSPFSNPYWLNEPHTAGLYKITDQKKAGTPWNDPFPEASVRLKINDQSITFTIPVTHKWTDPIRGELYRPFEVVPAVSINPSESVLVFPGSEKKSITIGVQSMVDSISGTLRVKVPEGWTVSPASAELTMNKSKNQKSVEFFISPNGKLKSTGTENVTMEIVFETARGSFDNHLSHISYYHIPQLMRLSKSSVKLVHLELKSVVKKIGYIEGAGDDVAQCLRQAGFDVTILDEKKILTESLSQYEAIVTGIRAYNTIENIDALYGPLMNYIEAGGNLVVQYNTSNFISSINSAIGPYPFKITRDRVTVENTLVQFDDPTHFLLNSPNKISMTDFNGWVQERGLYFAGELAPEYKTVISMNDPGEKPNAGSLIITQKGKGYFIYTGISFFRQLPAGVPGAYRLMTNLLNAGK